MTIKITTKEVEQLYLLCEKGEFKAADLIARNIGFKDGMNAEAFEVCIKKTGLTMQAVFAIAKNFESDIEANKKGAM